MTALIVISRIVLAAVFAAAGAAKLADREGTRSGVLAFGAPTRIAGALALLVPIAELVVAGLLLPAQTAVYGAIGALVLLAVFSAAIAWNLVHGRAPDCHCFGQLHSAPASWKTLVRNAVLAAVAVFTLWGSIAEPDASAVAWLGDLDGAELLALAVAVAGVVLLAVGAVAFLTLMRSYGNVLVRLDKVEAALAGAGIELDEVADLPEIGLEPGTAAPPFSLAAVSGETVSLDTITASGKPALLLFTSPSCGPCKGLLPSTAEWQREHAALLTVFVAADATAEEARAEAEEFHLDNVLIDEGRTLYDAYQANGTPSAVVVAADGTIGSWVASGSEWIEHLVADATSGPDREGLPIGADAPTLELPSLEGETVSVESLRGRDTLFLFWNPECGYCRAMHEDLLAWETSANGAATRLVVVSSGDEESTRAEGFGSLVLLDERFEAGSAFGASGTPMAVLVDAEGRIGSDAVAGADAVFHLANGRA